ncbi:MAG: hypothetical protein J0H17_18325 [Rhizobiales bacterium]|nr:hypothetical protein [Hyphomicrobiales bacterium]
MLNKNELIDVGERHTRRKDRTRGLREFANSRVELDRRLDQALEDTFPASDPVAIMICT